MPFLAHLWREWIADNPFLVQELRRWGRRKRRGRSIVGGNGFLLAGSFFLVVSMALVSLAMQRQSGGTWLTWGVPQLIPTAMAFHLLYVVMSKGSRFSLGREAEAGRLDFIRLCPMKAQEVMAKAAVTRAVLSLRPALIGLPVYVLLLPYSHLGLFDVLLFTTAMLLLCLGPPGTLEVSGALGTAEGSVEMEKLKVAGPSSHDTSGCLWGYVALMAVSSQLASHKVGALLSRVPEEP